MNQTTISVPSTTNKRNHKKVQNVSETLRKLKKMQTGMTISKTIVQGPKPLRKCKTEPKTYKEEGDDSEVDYDRDDEDHDPNFDTGAYAASDSDDNYGNGNDDDDDDYKPPGNKKAKTTHKSNNSIHILSQSNAKTTSTPINQKHKGIKVNAPPVFLCMKCKNRFESLVELKEHVFQKNACTVSQLTCNVCEKTFDTKKRMTQHMKTHEEKVQFICDKCGKMYKNQFNLDTHKSAQHGEYLEEHQNVYKCRICSERFDNRTDLYTHMKNHSKDNQELLCDTCGKCFNNNHNLKNHIRTHLDIRPHECTFCDKKFRSRLLLKQHLHVHTGIKEFQCAVCDQQFAKRDSLRSHLKKRHPEYQPPGKGISINPTDIPVNVTITEGDIPGNIIEKPSIDMPNLTQPEVPLNQPPQEVQYNPPQMEASVNQPQMETPVNQPQTEVSFNQPE